MPVPFAIEQPLLESQEALGDLTLDARLAADRLRLCTSVTVVLPCLVPCIWPQTVQIQSLQDLGTACRSRRD